jgi:hypothetical protein
MDAAQVQAQLVGAVGLVRVLAVGWWLVRAVVRFAAFDHLVQG